MPLLSPMHQALSDRCSGDRWPLAGERTASGPTVNGDGGIVAAAAAVGCVMGFVVGMVYVLCFGLLW